MYKLVKMDSILTTYWAINSLLQLALNQLYVGKQHPWIVSDNIILIY